jgi:hypothetical protein
MDDREFREKLNKLHEDHARTMALIQLNMTEEQLAKLRAHQERAQSEKQAQRRVEKIAEVAVAVIDLQLNLAAKTSDDVKYHRWPLGYCFGALDSVAQHYGFDWQTDGIALVTEGFALIMSEREAERYVRRCIELQEDRFFAEGREHGGDDFHQWLTTNGESKPLTLMNFFAFGKPAPLRELR